MSEQEKTDKVAELNKKYALLCQELGHLTSNKKKIEVRLAVIEAEIEKIDKAAAELNQAGA